MSFRVSQSRPRPRVHFEFTGLSGFLNFWDSECYRPRVPAGCKWALILCKGANSPSVNYRRQQWSARSDKFWSAPRCKLNIKMCQNILTGALKLSETNLHAFPRLWSWRRWDDECLCPVRLAGRRLGTEFEIGSTPASTTTPSFPKIASISDHECREVCVLSSFE